MNIQSGENGKIKNGLKIIVLGGLGEIGKNTMVIMYGDDLILVDAGLGFPSEDMLGVDIVLPDSSFLKDHAEKIRGLAVTHGHEDHIGGVTYLLREVGVPFVFGPPLALGLLEAKLKESGLENRTVLTKVKPRQSVQMGCFTVQFIRSTHSIADAFSLIIKTPVGTIVHTGDFKFDFTPVDGEHFDIASLARVSEDDGILLLMSDSTNSERDGFTPSEKTVWKGIDDAFAAAKDRIIVTTFASNVHRMRQILRAAMKYDRHVAIVGRSMLKLAGLSRDLGYMSFPDGLLVDVRDIREIAPQKLVIITTGSQGEPLSGLTRIARGEHKQIKIVPGDTVIFSATPIPGNERSVANTINSLFTQGANVIYGKDAGVHVSGHACREEQKLMINICKPKFFMPIHGEYRMLVRHAELAVECGVQPENTFVMENGEVLEIFADSAGVKSRVKAGMVLISNFSTQPVDPQTLMERQRLSEYGLVNVVLTLSAEKELLVEPDISIKGLTLNRRVTPEQFMNEFSEDLTRLISGTPNAIQEVPSAELHGYLINVISNYLIESMNIQPLVQLILNEVSVGAFDDKSGSASKKRKSAQRTALP